MVSMRTIVPIVALEPLALNGDTLQISSGSKKHVILAKFIIFNYLKLINN